MQFDDEYFGSEAQNLLMRRGRDLYQLVRADARLAFHGRSIILLGDRGGETAPLMARIARLCGASAIHFYPSEKTGALKAELTGLGQNAAHWEFCTGGLEAYETCKAILADVPLPGDLRLVRLSADSPAALVRATAELSMDCGVMPLPGRQMRGLANPGLCLVAVDASGAPVATGSSYRYTHPDSDYRDHAFWGVLATRPDRRGQKLAMILGAHAIVRMWEEFGMRGFTTGIKADNPASLAVCARQGVRPSGQTFIACTNPEHFGDAPITR